MQEKETLSKEPGYALDEFALINFDGLFLSLLHLAACISLLGCA